MAESKMTRQDERLFAAISHLSALFPFMGMIVPVVIWATQKEKSEFVCFQALQAAAYQLVLFIVTFFSVICYMAAFAVAMLASFVGIIAIPLTSSAGGDSESIAVVIATLFTLLPSFLPFALFGLVFILGIAAVLYAIIAAVLTFEGKDFRYVLIGKRVERYLNLA